MAVPILTHIHHRQTPLFLIQGVVQAGVTWQSEAMFQEHVGHPIRTLISPAGQNTTAIYAGAEFAERPSGSCESVAARIH